MSMLRMRTVASRARGALLISTAITGLASAPALAQDATGYRPVGSESIDLSAESRIVISSPGTPASAQDAENINGIGIIVSDGGGGSVGICTGSLINPRMVLFAAHCVNDLPQEAYGAATGGKPISVGFRQNALGGIIDWLLGTETTAPYATSLENQHYNVNQIKYDPASLALGPDLSFLEADVAVATLDAPARDVPTWTLLFSALPAPRTIAEDTGTGYHVTISGYGGRGVGANGANLGIDFRRRVAENTLGVLGSIDDRNLFLFGSPDGLPQNLYQLDFDDPNRGTDQAYPFDFNVFKDDALPREGTTAGGDSGGPLILDQAFNEDVIIGVLSGGSRFFGPQPFSAYGTTSFYQPLYLFWDYIAANNPYRYVSAAAGDGNWTDPGHWVSEIDPAYRVLNPAGQLVAGIPTDPGAGATGEDPNQFGQVCIQLGSTDECFDLGTQTLLVDGVPTTGAGNPSSLSNNAGSARINQDRLPDATRPNASQGAGTVTSAALPRATLENGLPGATGFVPNNIDPDPAAGIDARYFEVNLRATGTTTLSSEVEIDRFRISGPGARLTITPAGSLTSLIDITQATGVLQVDGTLSSEGDYFLMTGGLTGSGVISTPYLTSMAGMIAPGTPGTIGTLTINGALGTASGTNLLIDIGANGQSDRLVVNATGSGDEDDGAAVLGGQLGLAPVAGYRIRAGDAYTIVEAENGVTGDLQTTALSAILTPVLSFGANALTVEIEAGRYADVIDRGSGIQSAYAQLLDQNRAAYGQLAELYGTLDLLSAPDLRNTLEALAPRTPALQGAMATVATDVLSRFIRDRIGTVAAGDAGGTVAMYGRPVQLAALATSNLAVAAPQSDAGIGADVQQTAIADDASLFLAGGYIDGRGSGLPGSTPGGRSDFDGYFIVAGAEKAIDENGFLGFAFSYSDLDGTAGIANQTGSGKLYQGTVYGAASYANGLIVDAQVSAGAYELRSSRAAPLGADAFTLTSRDRAFTFASEGGIGFKTGDEALSLTPRAAVRYNHIGFTPTAEQGGPAALQYDAGSFDSLQARGGVTAKASIGTVRPFANVTYVHEFEDRPAGFNANFVGGIGPSAIFALPGTDKDWGEISGGLMIGSDRIQASLSAETTVNRSDLRNQSYRASMTLRF